MYKRKRCFKEMEYKGKKRMRNITKKSHIKFPSIPVMQNYNSLAHGCIILNQK
jgi:hypothetical protein